MNNFSSLVKGEFHGSLLNGICQKQNGMVFEIEYYDENDDLKNINILIVGVEHTKKNDCLINNIEMQGEYASIIWLCMKKSIVTLGLDWRNCSSGDTGTCVYDLLGSDVRLELDPVQWID